MGKTALSPLDPSSFSRPELAKVTAMALNLNVSFDKKILSGSAELTVKKVDKTIKEIILDTLKLKISSIYDVETKEKLDYELSDSMAEYGAKLTVQLPKVEKCDCGSSYKICIEYETSPEATGLQWLSPNATAGKTHPYLFSQFQPTHARSVLPCQDTPGVKTPYTAAISAPPEFTVLMSAVRDGVKDLNGGKLSHFVQKVPIPSYLLALVVGVIESREIGPRSHVWSEKEIIEECAYEFANTEHQLKTAEELCGPYLWGIYDILVLPPSFPYGGMENPCLTFVTPTLLAGDRSLVGVIAHEITHSWSGNLVTQRNYEHFWLNEGFTRFIERKIKGRLESSQSQDFDAYTCVSDLNETINLMGETNPLTQLVLNLSEVHPDDAFSTVPYEKGQTFLRYLESVIGGPNILRQFSLQISSQSPSSVICLAGDRSLVNVVAHEIAHSWSGNLVTQRNYEHFWLNEGFTVFIERKIKGRLESSQSQDFDAYTYVSDLNEAINLMGETNPLTQLVLNLSEVHPDDSFSIVPYEKGQTFLRYLESVIGGPTAMEPFLRFYFEKYKYQSIDTDMFKSYFETYFAENASIKVIDWQTWLYGPGMPPIIPDYDKSLAVFCDELVEKFLSCGCSPITAEDKAKLSTSQVIYILQKISEKPAQKISRLQALNAFFDLDNVKNSEIKFRWFKTCLKAEWEDKVDLVFNWINVVGRMKFVRPLYRALYSWEHTRQKAIDNFKANRQNMMHVSVYNLAKDLHLDE